MVWLPLDTVMCAPLPPLARCKTPPDPAAMVKLVLLLLKVIAAMLGSAPSNLTVLPAAELNRTVSPATPRRPGGAMPAPEDASFQLPKVFQDPSVEEVHSACSMIVTLAVPVAAPLAARTVAAAPEKGGV